MRKCKKKEKYKQKKQKTHFFLEIPFFDFHNLFFIGMFKQLV